MVTIAFGNQGTADTICAGLIKRFQPIFMSEFSVESRLYF